MRAKFVPAGSPDVGFMVKISSSFHIGSDCTGTLEERVGGETWPKVILLLFVFLGFTVQFHWHGRGSGSLLRCNAFLLASNNR